MIKDYGKSKAREVIDAVHDVNKRKAELEESRAIHVSYRARHCLIISTSAAPHLGLLIAASNLSL